jgi:hypothetical protein
VYCADVGSIARNRFGWASCDSNGGKKSHGSSIEDFAESICKELSEGSKVALGFECPLFVPLPADPVELTRARRGEGSRPWCAGAGSGALAIRLTESAWVLSRIHDAVYPEPPLVFSWQEFSNSASGLLVWEAFVSGASKAKTHEGDAMLATESFVSALPDPDSRNLIQEPRIHSLAAAAALRAGWSAAARLIDEPCLVISA